MSRTKKLTLAAILSALTVTGMSLGSLVQVLDLSCVAVASVLVLFARIELGSPYDLFVYLASGILSFIFLGAANVTIPVLYLAFCGMYPILKARFERLSRRLATALKSIYFLVICAVLLAGAYFFSRLVLGIDFFEGSVKPYAAFLLPALYVVCVFVCFVYDRLLSQLVIIYMVKIRPKLSNILK